MNKVLELTGNSAAVLGVLMCLLAGINRLVGHYYVWGYGAMTLFTVGTGLMVLACLSRLYRIRIP